MVGKVQFVKVVHVVGARPNFMKIAPVYQEMKKYADRFHQLFVHTGQHYDTNMSDVFLSDLGMPQPDINLNVGSGSHAVQTAKIMEKFEAVVLDFQPDWVIVPGDVNSTLACALVASKLGIKVAHVEAGLRSFDRTMPEEINRVLADHLSDLLFTSEPSGKQNLVREGIEEKKIFFVGNTMIDTLIRLLPRAEMRWQQLMALYDLSDGDQFILVTLHRPANVDDSTRLKHIVEALIEVASRYKVIFPVHPRTRTKLDENNISVKGICMLEPLGYLDFLCLETKACLVITDSGGIQEETTYLGVPCITVRPNTERPITLTHGTNQLVAPEKHQLIHSILERMVGDRDASILPPPLWDGKAAQRIVEVFKEVGQ